AAGVQNAPQDSGYEAHFLHIPSLGIDPYLPDVTAQISLPRRERALVIHNRLGGDNQDHRQMADAKPRIANPAPMQRPTDQDRHLPQDHVREVSQMDGGEGIREYFVEEVHRPYLPRWYTFVVQLVGPNADCIRPQDSARWLMPKQRQLHDVRRDHFIPASAQKTVPLPVRTQHLVRLEIGLVFERSAPGDEVAEI